MFRLIKWLLIFAIVIGLVAVVAALFLPNESKIESSIEIQASQQKVFTHAKDLPKWHLLAMLGGLPGQLEAMKSLRDKIPNQPAVSLDNLMPGLTGQLGILSAIIPGLNPDSLMSGASSAKELMNMKCEITKAESPGVIEYKISGGPMNGASSEIKILALSEARAKLTLTEQVRFEGFFGSFRALMSKYGGEKINQVSLGNLKKLCEQ